MKIAPPAGGGIGVIACRSTSTSSNNDNNKHKNSTPVSLQQRQPPTAPAKTPVHQHKSDFEDSAEDGARKKTAAAAAALEKNVLSRCHHLVENGGSRKKMACSSKQSTNFLHDNDFTFIDADDDLQSITESGKEEVDPALENVTGDNGCDCTDNACSSETNICGSHISTAAAADHDSGDVQGKLQFPSSREIEPNFHSEDSFE